MKIVFLGSSDLAVFPLRALVEKGHEILGVVCQPDRPNARGNKIEISELKRFAVSHNIPVLQFQKIKCEEGVYAIRNLKPELLVVVYFGQILSQEIIDIGTKGIINLHPSLLPKYRGPSPVISPILNGEKKAGVTIMRVEKAVDSGDIILQEETPIFEGETGGQLWERLTKMGTKMLLKAIEQIQNGTTKERKQDDTQATFTHMFKKEDSKIDFNKKSEQIVNQVRGFNPSLIAYFDYQGERIKVYEAETMIDDASKNKGTIAFENGSIVKSSVKEGLIIKSADGFVSILKLQAPNGKVLNIKDFLNGRKFEEGYIIKK
jgi:methionyl-tRNA formyltransferase